jgi:Family of unknown function (DUF6062)
MPDPSSGYRTVEPSLQEILDAIQMPPEVSEGMLQVACPLCITVNASVIRTLKAHFYEFVNDPESRVRLRSSKGYCRHHAALLPKTGDALGTAILYADLTDLAIESLRNPAARGGLLSRFSTPRKPSPCPACTQAEEASMRYTQALAAGLERADLWPVLEQAAGLCTAHLEQTLSAASPECADKLRALEIRKLEALKAELEEIIRKNDYRFRHEPAGPEKDAWLRAPGKVVR